MRFDEYAGIEIAGMSLKGYMESFKGFTIVATKFLAEEGLVTRGADGLTEVDPSKWYPLPKALRVFHRAGEEVGDAVLRQIGARVALNATLPPGVESNFLSLAGYLDAGYHLSHRKNGVPMFDPVSGIKTEGIGEYTVRELSPRTFEAVCRNPFPCAFDLGIFEGAAKRVGGSASVRHLDDRPCRKRGADHCTLEIRLVRG